MDATEQQQHGRLRTLLLLSRTREALREHFPEESCSAAGVSCVSPALLPSKCTLTSAGPEECELADMRKSCTLLLIV